MSRSGRWDFQAHTHDLHTRVQTAPGQLGSPLTHRRWEPATGTRESLAAYRQRLTADFDAMFTAFTAHQVPRPRLFAYPFSEIGDVTTDPEAAAFSRDLIAARFVGALTNKSLAPEPSSRRSAADGQVERAEVYATTDATELVSAVVERTAVPAVVTDPFARAWDWRDQHGEPMTELSPLTAGRFTADSPRRAYGTLLAYASADWTGYTADATVRGLRTDGGTVTLLVGVNGDATVSVRVAYGRVALLRAGRVVAEAALTPAAGHRIAVTVRDGETVARVDGGPVLRVVTPTGPGATGGLAVAIDDAQGTTPPVGRRVDRDDHRVTGRRRAVRPAGWPVGRTAAGAAVTPASRPARPPCRVRPGSPGWSGRSPGPSRSRQVSSPSSVRSSGGGTTVDSRTATASSRETGNWSRTSTVAGRGVWLATLIRYSTSRRRVEPRVARVSARRVSSRSTRTRSSSPRASSVSSPGAHVGSRVAATKSASWKTAAAPGSRVCAEVLRTVARRCASAARTGTVTWSRRTGRSSTAMTAR